MGRLLQNKGHSFYNLDSLISCTGVAAMFLVEANPGRPWLVRAWGHSSHHGPKPMGTRINRDIGSTLVWKRESQWSHSFFNNGTTQTLGTQCRLGAGEENMVNMVLFVFKLKSCSLKKMGKKSMHVVFVLVIKIYMCVCVEPKHSSCQSTQWVQKPGLDSRSSAHNGRLKHYVMEKRKENKRKPSQIWVGKRYNEATIYFEMNSIYTYYM